MRAFGHAMGVADAGHVHTHQLELGAHVGAKEFTVKVTTDSIGCYLGHLVTGGNQAKNPVVPQGTLTNGEDIFIRSLAEVVDCNTAAFTHSQLSLTCQFILRTNTSREQDQVSIQVAAVGEVHTQSSLVTVDDFLGVLAGMHLHAQFFDHAAQHLAAAFVNLHCHQAGCKFHHMGFQSEVLQCFCSFQTK